MYLEKEREDTMYNLEIFIKMQQEDYDIALKEIESGKKKTHWIWYIFPRLKGLGSSRMADYYGIDGIEEARAYLENEYLRNHLIEIANALLALKSNNPTEILGYPDDLKVRSSMTLFYYADKKIEVFKKVIDQFYNGAFDKRTIYLLEMDN